MVEIQKDPNPLRGRTKAKIYNRKFKEEKSRNAQIYLNTYFSFKFYGRKGDPLKEHFVGTLKFIQIPNFDGSGDAREQLFQFKNQFYDNLHQRYILKIVL